MLAVSTCVALGPTAAASARVASGGSVGLFQADGAASGSSFSLYSSQCQGLADSRTSTSSDPPPDLPAVNAGCQLWLNGTVTFIGTTLGTGFLPGYIVLGTGQLYTAYHSIYFTYSFDSTQCGISEYCATLSGRGTDSNTGNDVTVYGPIDHTQISSYMNMIGSLAYFAPSPKSAPPTNTASPTISGMFRDGETVTASPGTWSGDKPQAYSYEWLSCNPSDARFCKLVSNAGETYKLTSAEVGRTILVEVTAVNDDGTAVARSSAYGPVVTATP